MKYAVYILTMKLWEWEGVKELADLKISKFGPDQYNTEGYNSAVQKIKELQDAIDVIKRMDATA